VKKIHCRRQQSCLAMLTVQRAGGPHLTTRGHACSRSASPLARCRERGYDMADHYLAASAPNGRGHIRHFCARHLTAPITGAQGADLGRLVGHLGYFVRRAQLWIFQDFIRTLAKVDIRPAQYSVLLLIEANPGLSQSTLAQTLGIE